MSEKKTALKARIAGICYQALNFGQEKLPPGVRSVVGFLCMICGVLGFLPVLGFWMLPLGMALIGLDIPPARKHIQIWMEKLRIQSIE
jgi:hypothetical protein|tara:strand:+ start:1461 stop:1724 length:264 start_codon:yes stop_codon:yes gene_type:complete